MKNFIKNIKKWSIRFILFFFISSILSVLILKWVPVYITPLMIIRVIEQKADGKDAKLSKEWKSLDKISPHLQLAVVCSEDQNFIKHNGFDFEAIQKAIKHNEKSDKKRGASTISQQTAKNVFLWAGRSWIRKGFEVYFTFLIELMWDKERIMEVYLNIVELGDGVYGAEAASQEFFNSSANKIDKRQAATLAVVLPSPLRYNAKKPGKYLQKRIDWTLRQMRLWGGKLDYSDSSTNKQKK